MLAVLAALTTLLAPCLRMLVRGGAGCQWRRSGLVLLCSSLLCVTPTQRTLSARPDVKGAAAGTGRPVGPAGGTLHGTALHASFFSHALSRRMDYWVYLPPGYWAATARYRVLYLLHGRGGSSDQWPSFGLFDEADRLIRRGRIVPLLIVTPQGDFGYWMNHANHGPRWGDYVTTDLIGHVDTTYRTQPQATHRAIGGVSMGGHGALQLALTHLELFGAVGAHSPVVRREHEAFAFFGVGAEYQRRDPLSLVRDLRVDVPFQLWVDMGAQDPWLAATVALHQALVRRGIRHTWHRFPGGHDGTYWRQHVAEYLEWYDVALRGHGLSGHTTDGAADRHGDDARQHGDRYNIRDARTP